MKVNLTIFFDNAADTWVIVCREFAMVSQTKVRSKAIAAWMHVFYGTILVELEHGKVPSFRPVYQEDVTYAGETEEVDVLDHPPSWFREAAGKLIQSWMR